jgi:lipoate-protein ligase A
VKPYALWIDPVPRPGWANMAIDQALLGRAALGERWLRMYRWDPACLSFGRHEPAARRYDRARIAALGLSVVRRPTGGRAVWHARELTYAVAAPAAALGLLRDAYLAIHAVLRDAVRALGAAAELAPADRSIPVDAGACFARAAGGEVIVGGAKVVGSAQLRRDGAVLQHGSLLLGDDQTTVAAVTVAGAPSDGSAPLSRVLGRVVEWEEAADAVCHAAAAHWGPPHDPAVDATRVVAQSADYVERYRSSTWTWDPEHMERPTTAPPPSRRSA